MRILPVLSALLLLSLPATAQTEQSPRVTSDTPEYCGSLAARLAANPAAAREPSRSLAAQGVELCGKGHVRTGIAKLRRALRAAQAASLPVPAK
jgi:hypothetical protein